MTQLTERKGRVLRFIVSDYISTASPVASGAVARASGLHISPATARSEMGALEEGGYILRPHISAGGIPSDRGYRHFVDSLDPAATADLDDAGAVQANLALSRHDFVAWADGAASALAALLGSLAFATTPREPAPLVKGIELLKLQEMIIMLVVVLREASVHRELISLDRPVTGQELEHARNRLSETVTGKTAEDLRAAAHAAADPLDQKVLESTAEVLRLRDAEALGERVFQGLRRLLEQPEFAADPVRARNVVATIEDAAAFGGLADQAPGDGSAVTFIGAENKQEALRGVSVVLCRYGVAGEAQGVIGLVGPTRMAYSRALPVIKYAADSLGAIAGRVYGP